MEIDFNNLGNKMKSTLTREIIFDYFQKNIGEFADDFKFSVVNGEIRHRRMSSVIIRYYENWSSVVQFDIFGNKKSKFFSMFNSMCPPPNNSLFSYMNKDIRSLTEDDLEGIKHIIRTFCMIYKSYYSQK